MKNSLWSLDIFNGAILLVIAIILLFLAIAQPQITYASSIAGAWSQLGLSGRYVNTLVNDPTNPNILYAGTDNGIYKSTDGGGAWILITESGNYAFIVAIAPSNHNVLYASRGNNMIQKSIDGGQTWIDITNNFVSSGSPYESILDIAIDPTDPNKVYVGLYQNRGVWITTDGGNTWTPHDLGDTYRVAIAPSDESIVYVGAGGTTLFKSTDAGESWNNPGNNGIGFPGAVRGVAIDPIDSNIVYVGIEGSGVWKTTDGGINFIYLENSPSNVVSLALVIDPNDNVAVYARSSFGVSVSTDGGLNWSVIDNGQAPSNIERLILFPNNHNDLYATTSNGVYVYGLIENPISAPTDKSQCKNDGWKQFTNPKFKNQGDCVSYVATHGKNPGNG